MIWHLICICDDHGDTQPFWSPLRRRRRRAGRQIDVVDISSDCSIDRRRQLYVEVGVAAKWRVASSALRESVPCFQSCAVMWPPNTSCDYKTCGAFQFFRTATSGVIDVDIVTLQSVDLFLFARLLLQVLLTIFCCRMPSRLSPRLCPSSVIHINFTDVWTDDCQWMHRRTYGCWSTAAAHSSSGCGKSLSNSVFLVCSTQPLLYYRFSRRFSESF